MVREGADILYRPGNNKTGCKKRVSSTRRHVVGRYKAIVHTANLSRRLFTWRNTLKMSKQTNKSHFTLSCNDFQKSPKKKSSNHNLESYTL